MRSAEITYGDGTKITTSVNGTDDDIKAYFKIGRKFNLGNKFDPNTGDPLDNMQPIKKVKILK